MRLPEEVPARSLLGYDDPAHAPEATAVEKLTLKRGDYFAVTSRVGDIAPAGARDMGFFREDTRFLSYLHFFIEGSPAVVLSAQTSTDYVTQVDMTVSRSETGEVLMGDPVNYLHVRREQVIEEQLTDRFVLTSYSLHPAEVFLVVEFAADFADVFEIRGWKRARRGTYLRPEVSREAVTWAYRGLDGRLYRSELRFSEKPEEVDAGRARFRVRLEPYERRDLELRVLALVDGEAAPPLRVWEQQVHATRETYRSWGGSCTRITTSDDRLNAALEQGVADLAALSSTREGEPVIAAGIPWYTCPFGRDTLITAYEALPVNPRLARDALRYLARHQGTRVDAARDEEPGKILHEVRSGEMARTGEIPHTPYFGSIDATPLFVVLLGEYFLWTDDRATVTELLPAARRAMLWMEEHGDRDGDGLLEYGKRGAKGLDNQGWKDSRDGVIFADGRLPSPPIALVEVQGYACDARRRMAQLERGLGIGDLGRRMFSEARRLQRRIEERFWMPRSTFYAQALDGEKRQVDALTSNPGHLLWSGAVGAERARQVALRLMSPEFFSGWGIRTLAGGQPAYNPLSYHDGTVWPHDNALVAMGLCNYGMNDLAVEVLGGLYHASLHFRHHRLPELFCGLGREEGEFPVHYPVACSPQAWSSAAFFLLLRACLGLYPDAPRRTLHVRDPRLPSWLSEVRIDAMQVGASRVSLRFSRSADGISAAVTRVDGEPVRVRMELSGS